MIRLENLQSLVGLTLILLACWAMSEDRRKFPWKLAAGAIALQAVLVLALFGVPALRAVLAAMGGAVDGLAASTQTGVAFVFGFLAARPTSPMICHTRRTCSSSPSGSCRSFWWSAPLQPCCGTGAF